MCVLIQVRVQKLPQASHSGFFNSTILVKSAVFYPTKQLMRHKHSLKGVSLHTPGITSEQTLSKSAAYYIQLAGCPKSSPLCTGITSRNPLKIQTLPLWVQDKDQNIYLFNATHGKEFIHLSDPRCPTSHNTTESTCFYLTSPLPL